MALSHFPPSCPYEPKNNKQQFWLKETVQSFMSFTGNGTHGKNNEENHKISHEIYETFQMFPDVSSPSMALALRGHEERPSTEAMSRPGRQGGRRAAPW